MRHHSMFRAVTRGAIGIALTTLLAGNTAAAPQAPLPSPRVPAPLPYPQPAGLPGQPPPTYPSAELDRIVSPIALYPDPLLAQVLTAATFASQIPTAAQWVDRHRGLTGEQLAEALASEQVSWDPSEQALVAFHTVIQI